MPQQADLLGKSLGFGRGFLEQQLERIAQFGALAGLGFGALLQGRQLFAALGEAIGGEHHLLQLAAIGGPGIAQVGQSGALFQLRGDGRQGLFVALLVFNQRR